MAVHTQEAAPTVVAEMAFAASGWFAAKQPGIIRFIEGSLGRERSEVCAVGLAVAVRLCGRVAQRDGIDPPRITSTALENVAAKLGSLTARDLARDPDVISRAVDAVHQTGVPLSRDEWLAVARVTAVVDLALSSTTRGLGF